MATNNNKPISALAANSLKPNNVLADAHPNRGLRLKANINGSKTWIYRYRNIEGKLKQIKLGNYPAITITKARSLFADQKELRNNGVDLAQQKRDQKAEKLAVIVEQKQEQKRIAYTVERLVEDYYNEHIKLERKPRGAAQAYSYLYKHVVDVFGDVPATDITVTQVHEHLTQLKSKTPSVALKVKTDLKAAFELGLTSGRIELPKGNPVRLTIKYKADKAKQIAFNDVQLFSWFKWLDTAPLSQNIKDCFVLTLLTGCRTGELTDATWNNINFKQATLFLPETKNEESRYVQLSTQAIALLQTRKNLHDVYIFPSHKTGKAITQASLSKKLTDKANGEAIIDNCPVGYWTPHDLRRTVRTAITKPHIGCSIHIAEIIIGHTREELEITYDKNEYSDEQREFLQKWCDHLDVIRGAK